MEPSFIPSSSDLQHHQCPARIEYHGPLDAEAGGPSRGLQMPPGLFAAPGRVMVKACSQEYHLRGVSFIFSCMCAFRSRYITDVMYMYHSNGIYSIEILISSHLHSFTMTLVLRFFKNGQEKYAMSTCQETSVFRMVPRDGPGNAPSPSL